MGKRIRRDVVRMDLLWEDHEWLSRIVMMDIAHALPSLQYDVDWLLSNQDQIGENFGKLVKDHRIGEKLGLALREHITIAAEVFTLAKNKQDYSDAYARWMENAELIGKIYHKGKKSISERRVTDYMISHNEGALRTALNIFAGNFANAVVSGEEELVETKDLTDYLTEKLN